VADRRRLIVIRHAKAEPFASTDHERRLTERGRAGAHDAGAHLREVGLVPDYAVVSSAIRTRETWSAVAEETGTTCEVSFDDAVFSGSPNVVIDALSHVPPGSETVVFVGHNPTAAYLCHHLDDGEGDPKAVTSLLQGFPPGALAVLDVSTPWDELGAESASVVGFHVGAG
jgi:phosphohistidine phosphatase